MTTALAIAAWMVGGYLAGSVPFGWLIGRARGYDIREHGSKNIGATNCGRVCGAPWGVLAFLLDVAKGFLPVLAAVELMPDLVADSGRTLWLAVVLAGLGPVLGHTFPAWLRFRGGKAVATSLGVVFALPMLRWVGLAAFGLWVIVFVTTRYVSVASTAGAVGLLAGYLVFERRDAWDDFLPVTVFVLLLVALVLARHKANYRRLMEGTENRFGSPPAHTAAQQLEFGQPAPPEPDIEAAEEGD